MEGKLYMCWYLYVYQMLYSYTVNIFLDGGFDDNIKNKNKLHVEFACIFKSVYRAPAIKMPTVIP